MIFIFLIFFSLFSSCPSNPQLPSDQIRVIVFDFGEVVVQKNFDPLAQFLATELNITFEQGKAILVEREEALLRSESEKLFFKNVFHNFGKEVPQQFYKKFRKKMVDCIFFDKKVVEIIENLKEQNRRVILFSNTEKHKADIYRELGYYAPFDQLVLSYEIGMRKPQKAAYDYVEKQVHFLPHEALFIDNKIENVLQAKKHHWNALLFSSPEQLKKDLEELGFCFDQDFTQKRGD